MARDSCAGRRSQMALAGGGGGGGPGRLAAIQHELSLINNAIINAGQQQVVSFKTSMQIKREREREREKRGIRKCQVLYRVNYRDGAISRPFSELQPSGPASFHSIIISSSSSSRAGR